MGARVLDLHGERRRSGGAALTARERQILGLLATPASLDDIAADLAAAMTRRWGEGPIEQSMSACLVTCT